MLRALALAIRQLNDPAFFRPLLFGALLAALGAVGLVFGVGWGLGEIAGGTGWFAGAVAAAGGVLTLFAVWWLFVPLLLAVASLFLDGVAAAVERRHYPHLPPPVGTPVATQIWSGAVLAGKLGLLTLVLLPLSLMLPLIGAVALWGVAAIGIGEGLFLGVAQRRMPAAEAEALRARRRAGIWTLGGTLALAGLLGPLALLVPVVGTAAMVHLFHRRAG